MASPDMIYEISPRQAAGLSKRWRNGFLVLFLTLALGASIPGAALARGGGTPAKKLGRGAVNVTLGVLALPGQVVQTTREHGVFLGLTWGVVKGIGWTVATESVGLWEVITCPFETPPEFVAILNPVYPWQHFTHIDDDEPGERRVASERSNRRRETRRETRRDRRGETRDRR